MTQGIGNQRLLALAELLRNDEDPEMFDMSIDVHDCGTPACALGHASLLKDSPLKILNSPGFCRIITTSARPVLYEVKRYFSINMKDFTELFSSSGCGGAQTPNEAAEYISHFVSRRRNTTNE